MKVYKSYIVDDEYWARISLMDKLEKIPEIEIVGFADSVASAIEGINRLNPEILFLDIQLINGTGFDILNQIKYSGHIIFITAYDEYALRAFEVNALDYLMKPVSTKRLQLALNRIKNKSEPAFEKFTAKYKYDDRLMVQAKDYIHFIEIKNIVLISASKDYTTVTIDSGQKYLLLRTMHEWEERLPEQNFCRFHRSHIVNFNYIDKVIKNSPNSASIFIKGIDDALKISRSYYKKIKDKYL